ncbi:hypothetical protein EV193_105200 [Herbihabitans rhizosphaerae]|uniref:Uncharacterized protein n=1 Tax=Herbihabitans rhizosphaerae TaxID=1872711 RepID=A0A4Q7KQP0_9PSEU|nr:hypothetical protein [Herbihabitans rhizosphaerae]RZS37642.1 hypothetical protein EV193_105200 [Herbihabitans rhizosphaerae]
MPIPEPGEADLLRRLAEPWLAGETITALAAVGHLLQDKYKVRGLDDAGAPVPSSRVERVLDAITDDGVSGYVTVRGEHPSYLAVAVYRAAGESRAWLVITSRRLAVLRLRDMTDSSEENRRLLADAQQERSVSGVLRGVGKLVRNSATSFAANLRRPPLPERPVDAVLECAFEVDRGALAAVVSWKPPMQPSLGKHGPRWFELRLADGSLARLETDAAGAEISRG